MSESGPERTSAITTMKSAFGGRPDIRPRGARGFRRFGRCGLASMYPAFDWSVVLRAHHGYQRASVLITGQASTDHLGHQVSRAPGRPNLHLLFILSQTLAGKRATRECYTA